MITRDSKASISGTAQDARQRLGEVIRHYREDRDLDRREVSRRCKVAIAVVEEWEDGKRVPNSDEWKALCRGVNRALNQFSDLYNRARNEADEAARARAAQNMKEQPKPMNPTTKINNTLGDKLAKVIATPPAPAPVPAPDPAPLPKLEVVPTPPEERKIGGRMGHPPGSYSGEAIARRRAFVRDLLLQRPRIRTSGADSVVEAVRKAFGLGISPEVVEEIRAEIERDKIKAEIRAEMLPHPAPVPEPKAAPVVTATEPATREGGNHEADINTAVALILDAIPGLQTFTLAVDENGEASVDFQIRKVRVETVGGSIKVRR